MIDLKPNRLCGPRDAAHWTERLKPQLSARIKRILVVDDDEDIRQLLTAFLAGAGFDANAVSDGLEAWQALLRERFDLLITDNDMPRLAGLELIHRMRAAGMTLPVILASGNLAPARLRECSAGRSVALLPKPFAVWELLYAVTNALHPPAETPAPDGIAVRQWDSASCPEPTRPREPSPNPTRPSRSSKLPQNRILIADDDPTVRDSLQDVLLAEGYLVISAENGRQALQLLDTTRVDLALLDLNMPVMNGWDAFERFTAEHPLLPIIIATARPNQLFTALSAGAGALLEKPMDIPTLLRTMETLLAESAEQRLARLAGKKANFHYQRATTCPEGDPLEKSPRARLRT